MTLATSNAKILEIAKLMRQADENRRQADWKLFEREMKRLNEKEALLVVLAGALLKGNRFPVVSDDPELNRRCRGFAEEIGATVDEQQGPGAGETSMMFFPPHDPQH
jgi:hypothetical protein